MKSKKRQKQQRRKAAKQARYLKEHGESRYARKKAWCDKNGMWGWEVPSPKPWGK